MTSCILIQGVQRHRFGASDVSKYSGLKRGVPVYGCCYHEVKVGKRKDWGSWIIGLDRFTMENERLTSQISLGVGIA